MVNVTRRAASWTGGDRGVQTICATWEALLRLERGLPLETASMADSKTVKVSFSLQTCVILSASYFCYSLRAILLFVSMDVSRYILELDTSILMKSNMGRRELAYFRTQQSMFYEMHQCSFIVQANQ
jgi:hypothetical protein